MSEPVAFDLVVVGAGPAGQKAAIQAAKTGHSALVVERGVGVGGECVHHGTIPSKTLRQSALALTALDRASDGLLRREIPPDLTIEMLTRRQHQVREAHERYLSDQLTRNGVTLWEGHARCRTPHEIEVTGVDGSRRWARGVALLIASGSRPRTPPEIPVDHERVLDSDSILTLTYLPRSLAVLGGGVIACEFASIFSALGVAVTLVDRGPRPMPFVDPELTDVFLAVLGRRGGRHLAGRRIASVQPTGVAEVTITLADGEELRTEKVLCALGRTAVANGLGLEDIGVRLDAAGLIVVDREFRTSVPSVYAVGDVIGPPALAATAMEQGRLAARHALGLGADESVGPTPIGIYTLPEMASVGLGEDEAREGYGAVRVGRARFSEITRGWIAGDTDGLLKLVVRDGDGLILGAHIVGEGATELIHVAQVALVAGLTYPALISNVFNFPTTAEAYRVAALHLAGQPATGRDRPARAA